jgi:hypothetical protein
MPIVTFFVPQLSHAIETMAYFLAIEGACLVRLATILDTNETTNPEHPGSLRRIKDFGKIEIASYESPPEYSDVLVFYLMQHHRISNRFYAWRVRARSAAYLSSSDGPLTSKGWLREKIRSFPYYLYAKKITLEPYIHPQLIVNSEWMKASFEPIDPDAGRRWRLGFLGNYHSPPGRMMRLTQCKDALVDAEHGVNWHEYGPESALRGLNPMDYMQALSEIDFCISPPGWLSWTHRTIEALVSGSIPIVEDPQHYQFLELRDGENCIVAKSNEWGVAVRRALSMSEEDIRRIRRKVAGIRQEQLLPQKAIERFRSQLFA